MAKQSSVNLDITNNADGFSISGGTIGRTLGISGGDVTLVGSGAATLTFPTTSTTIAGLGIAQTFTALQTFNAGITTANITTGTTLGSGSNVMTFPSSTTTLAGLGIAQTFTALNQFSAGLSATSGCSFNNATVYITNSSAVDPLYVQHNSANGLKVASTGQARSGSIRLGNAANSTQNIFISQTDGTLTLYNGFSTTGSNMLSLSSSALNVGVTVSGLTLNALLRSTAGISASGGITGGSYIVAESGFRVGSGSINTQIDSYVLTSSDNGKVITVNAATSKTITVPSGLPVGFNCTVIRLGSGAVSFSASGTTINSVSSFVSIASQHGAASLISYTTDVFNLSGNLA